MQIYNRLWLLWHEHRGPVIGVLVTGICIAFMTTYFITRDKPPVSSSLEEIAGIHPAIVEEMYLNQQQGTFYVSGYMLDDIVVQRDEVGTIALYYMYHVLTPDKQELRSLQTEYAEFLTYEYVDNLTYLHPEERWRPVVYRVRVFDNGETVLTKY